MFCLSRHSGVFAARADRERRLLRRHGDRLVAGFDSVLYGVRLSAVLHAGRRRPRLGSVPAAVHAELRVPRSSAEDAAQDAHIQTGAR